MNWRAPESSTQSCPKRAMGAAKRETSRRAVFPGASELSSVAVHPLSVSLSVSVAAPTTSPHDLGPDQHGRFDVLDHHPEPHQIRHRRLHLAPPLLVRRERGGVERPQPRPPRAVLRHVADQPPHLLARQWQLVLVHRGDAARGSRGAGPVAVLVGLLTRRRARRLVLRVEHLPPSSVIGSDGIRQLYVSDGRRDFARVASESSSTGRQTLAAATRGAPIPLDDTSCRRSEHGERSDARGAPAAPSSRRALRRPVIGGSGRITAGSTGPG